jgi:hypothetical protein
VFAKILSCAESDVKKPNRKNKTKLDNRVIFSSNKEVTRQKLELPKKKDLSKSSRLSIGAPLESCTSRQA